MGDRRKCLHTFAEAWILVVLASIVLQHGTATEQSTQNTHVNPLLSVDVLKSTKPNTRQGHDFSSLTIAFVNRTRPDVDKAMVLNALAEAWDVYANQKQRFLRFDWMSRVQGKRCTMWVAFGADEEFIYKHQEALNVQIMAEPEGALVGVIRTDHQQWECVASFAIPDEEKGLEVFSKSLREYAELPGHQPGRYGFLRTMGTWSPNVNPLVSLNQVLKYASENERMPSNTRGIVLKMSRSGGSTLSATDKEMCRKALIAAWGLYREKKQQRFFRFGWTHKVMWVAFSSNGWMMDTYGEAAIKGMLEELMHGLVAAMTRDQYRTVELCKAAHEKDERNAVACNLQHLLEFHDELNPTLYEEYAKHEECVAAYIVGKPVEEEMFEEEYETLFMEYVYVFQIDPF